MGPVQLFAKPPNSGAQAPEELQLGDNCVLRAGVSGRRIPATMGDLSEPHAT